MDKYKKIILKDTIKNIKSAKESLSYTKDIKKITQKALLQILEMVKILTLFQILRLIQVR